MADQILVSIVLLYALWVLYLASMNLIRAKDAGTISKSALWLGYPLVIFAVVFDWLCNVVPASILFGDLPRQWVWMKVGRLSIPYFTTELVTGRLKRYAYDTRQTWRRALALWIGINLLDAFDPSGQHV